MRGLDPRRACQAGAIPTVIWPPAPQSDRSSGASTSSPPGTDGRTPSRRPKVQTPFYITPTHTRCPQQSPSPQGLDTSTPPGVIHPPARTVDRESACRISPVSVLPGRREKVRARDEPPKPDPTHSLATQPHARLNGAGRGSWGAPAAPQLGPAFRPFDRCCCPPALLLTLAARQLLQAWLRARPPLASRCVLGAAEVMMASRMLRLAAPASPLPGAAALLARSPRMRCDGVGGGGSFGVS